MQNTIKFFKDKKNQAPMARLNDVTYKGYLIGELPSKFAFMYIHHRTTVTKGNFCKPFTEKEHRKVKTKSKGAGSKGRKHAHTKLWTYHNSGVSFKTNTKKVR
jgi:hypothetical protein